MDDLWLSICKVLLDEIELLVDQAGVDLTVIMPE